MKGFLHVWAALRGMLAAMLLLMAGQSQAQTYPVQASVQLLPPYSVYLSDYASPMTDRLVVNLLSRDLSEAEVEVRLKLRIENQSGQRVETRYGYQPTPIRLQAGAPLRLTGADLAPYLQAQNLDFRGINRNDFLQSGKLPEGYYNVCIEVYEYYRGARLSLPGCGSGWLVQNEPPLLVAPANNEKPRAQDPQQLVFQWTPRHTGSPNAAFTTEYEFTLTEVWPEGRNPNEAMRTTQPLFQTVTQSSMLVYGPGEPPLVPGRRYAWRVQARAQTGAEAINLFENEGYSEVFSFQWGDACLAPLSLEAEALPGSRIQLSWQGQEGHTGYTVYYRQAGSDGRWYSKESFQEEKIITDLQPETRYEFKVLPACGSISGLLSNTDTLSTLVEPEPLFSCGLPLQPFDLENTNFLQGLNTGDIIEAGDFKVMVTEASGSGGTFSGQGIIAPAWFQKARLNVVFENIQLRDDYRLVAGQMQVTGAALDIIPEELEEIMQGLEELDQVLADAETAIGIIDSIDAANNPPTEHVALEDEEIVAVTVEEDGTIVIEDTDGTQHRYPAYTDAGGQPAPVYVGDGKGNRYVVDSQGGVHNLSQEPVAHHLAFAPAASQKYGFDSLQYDALAGQYEPLQLGGEMRRIAWKSFAEGQSDAVSIRNAGSGFPSGVKFRKGASPLSTGQASGSQLELTLTAPAAGFEEPLVAYLEQADSSGTSYERLLAQLNLVSYKATPHKLYIVPAGATASPINGTSLATALNNIYAPAAISWQLSVLEPQNLSGWDANNDNKLDDGETGMLAAYTAEMRSMASAFFATHTQEEDAFYLFIAPEAASGSSKLGYMPRNRNVGYVFAEGLGTNQSLWIKTIAHELGHGAFNLQHTFSEYSTLSEGSTNNLMDYQANGTTLIKSQWDNIHNPETVYGIFEEDEDGAAFGEGPGGICIGELQAIQTLNQQYQHFYLPDGRIFDTQGKYLVSGFFKNNEEEPEVSRGSVFSLRINNYDYYHAYSGTSENTTVGYSLKFSEDVATIIKADKLSILESSNSAVRVHVDKDAKVIKVYRNGEQIGEAISFGGSCNCNKLDPSRDLYFAFNTNTNHYVDYAKDNAKKLEHAFHEDEDVIAAVKAVVDQQKDTNVKDEAFLGEILADKLLTYEVFNERKFIVAPVEVNTLTVNQASWNQLAKAVFDQAGLSSSDILITVPYVHCGGIGRDLGEYFFMPGLAYGDDIQIDVGKLNFGQYENTQRVASFASGEISPIEHFIVDVFRHTSKKMLLYKAIFNASNTVECIEVRKDNVSGQAFNKTIRLYYQNSVDELAELIQDQKAEIKSIEDGLSDFLINPHIPANRKQAAQFAVDRRIRALKITHAEERLDFIREHATDKNISSYQSTYFNLKIREQYVDIYLEHERTKDLDLTPTFGLAYVYTDAFNDLRQQLEYSEEDLGSVDWQDEWSFNDKTDYILNQYDQSVYNSLDGASIVLGCFGFDFVADGLGLGYSLFRGDVVQAGGYSLGLFMVGPEGVAVSKASTSAIILLFTKNGLEEGSEAVGKKVMLDLAQKHVNEGHISQEVFEGLQNLEERELASALKSALNGSLDPAQFPFLKQLNDEALDKIRQWDDEIFLTLEYDLANDTEFAQKFIELANDDPSIVQSWKLLIDNSRGSFLSRDAARLEVFHKLSEGNKDLIKRFTDVDANSSLAKFIDDCDEEFLTFINRTENEDIVKSFLSHKEGIDVSAARAEFIIDEIDDLDGPLGVKVREWNKRSARISSNNSRFAKARAFEDANTSKVASNTNPPCGAWGGNTGKVHLPQLHVKANGSMNRVVLDDAIIDLTPVDIDELGNDIFRVIYHDSKLTRNAPWSTNQANDIITPFKNDPNLPYIELEVRSGDDYFAEHINSPIGQGDKIRIYREDVYKSIGPDDGSGSGISETIKMNDNGFN